MKTAWARPAIWACLLAAPPLIAAAADGAPATRVFSRYQGAWTLTTSRSGAPQSVQKIKNTCAPVGVYYMCEQRVGDASPTATVFAPTASAGIFHSTILATDGSVQQTGIVRVTGSRWEYPWVEADSTGQRKFFRVVNAWVDDAHVLFRKEVSADGHTWRLLESGDERKTEAQ